MQLPPPPQGEGEGGSHSTLPSRIVGNTAPCSEQGLPSRESAPHPNPLPGGEREKSLAPVSAEVAAMMGCDRHCTYCLVRLRRGPAQSRPVAEVVAECEELVRSGVREIVLLGQNIDVYGRDLPDHPTLADLLRRVHDMPGLLRLRFLTSHPADLEDEILATVAELPKLCPHWELPVQAGDDEVLRRMGRGHTAAQYLELAERIRARLPQECSIATDVIVGFPGETAEQFAHTLELLQAARLDAVHVACYSVRPGTPAARLVDDVPQEEKERRHHAVEELQERIVGETNARLLGQTVEVLVEGQHKGRWKGRTRTNKLVFFDSPEEWTGRLAQVRVTKTGSWSLGGDVL
jgi:tRNA-2-methylthio-N6-dimethylallyladenosine synthase